MNTSHELQWIDYLIMIIYFGFVLGIGFVLKRYMRTSSEFLSAGRSIPAWVAGLAFLSANLGAQEVIGMAASGAKYGIATSHFYWLGAIPAMVFVGIFMMPFYYGSRARSVPEYLAQRFGPGVHGEKWIIPMARKGVELAGSESYSVDFIEGIGKKGDSWRVRHMFYDVTILKKVNSIEQRRSLRFASGCRSRLRSMFVRRSGFRTASSG